MRRKAKPYDRIEKAPSTIITPLVYVPNLAVHRGRSLEVLSHINLKNANFMIQRCYLESFPFLLIEESYRSQ